MVHIKVERKKENHNKRKREKEKIILQVSYHGLSATSFLCGHRKTNCYSLLRSNFSCTIFEATSLISLCPIYLIFLFFHKHVLSWNSFQHFNFPLKQILSKI